jgi:hypothetical protein
MNAREILKDEIKVQVEDAMRASTHRNNNVNFTLVFKMKHRKLVDEVLNEMDAREVYDVTQNENAASYLYSLNFELSL